MTSQYEKVTYEQMIITDICFKNQYDDEDGNNLDSDNYVVQEADNISCALSNEILDKVLVKRRSNAENKIITQEQYSMSTVIADHAMDFTFVFMYKNASAEATIDNRIRTYRKIS
jgi:hypothetical protein